jgi:hypothetical protein
MSNTGLLGGSFSTAATNLGLDLQDQVINETEDQRKKRLQQLQQQQLLGPQGSMAVSSLFGRGLAGGTSGF